MQKGKSDKATKFLAEADGMEAATAPSIHLIFDINVATMALLFAWWRAVFYEFLCYLISDGYHFLT